MWLRAMAPPTQGTRQLFSLPRGWRVSLSSQSRPVRQSGHRPMPMPHQCGPGRINPRFCFRIECHWLSACHVGCMPAPSVVNAANRVATERADEPRAGSCLWCCWFQPLAYFQHRCIAADQFRCLFRNPALLHILTISSARDNPRHFQKIPGMRCERTLAQYSV